MLRIGALAVVFAIASCAWLLLGGMMTERTSEQQGDLYGSVSDLWGQPLDQNAPTITFQWQVPVETFETVVLDGNTVLDKEGKPVQRKTVHMEARERAEELASTDLTTDLKLDQRRKGLMWFSLYDVAFDGTWTWTHRGTEQGTAWLAFKFPVPDGMYDGFHFTVNGKDVADSLQSANGEVRFPVDVAPGDAVTFSIGYTSRGLDRWSYRPNPTGAGQIADFRLAMTTDFADIDYPPFTLSPSHREREGAGWKLDWDFARLVTGHGMGMSMPQQIQPGPLAAEMAFSAPISLGLFMLWIYVLALLKGLDIHPVNHLFIAGAFFAFHLLFGYSCDHLPVEAAFGISALVSVVLVVSYLRLVVGPKFAWREAGLAQIVYLIGFSLAHFWEGYTGLTVTILGILTLFGLMQLTGRIRWSEVFRDASTRPSLSPRA
jgi:hypothetical protein